MLSTFCFVLFCLYLLTFSIGFLPSYKWGQAIRCFISHNVDIRVVNIKSWAYSFGCLYWLEVYFWRCLGSFPHFRCSLWRWIITLSVTHQQVFKDLCFFWNNLLISLSLDSGFNSILRIFLCCLPLHLLTFLFHDL